MDPYFGIYYPNNAESNGNKMEERHGKWVYIEVTFGKLGVQEWIFIVVPIKSIIIVSMFFSIPSCPANQRPEFSPGKLPYSQIC